MSAYRVAALAERWQTHPSTIYNLVKTGQLKAMRLGGRAIRRHCEEEADMSDDHHAYCRDPLCTTTGRHVLSDDCEQMWPTCPQCGDTTKRLFEGYCEPCCRENQARLDAHNAEFDAWQGMTDAQRNTLINRAARS